MIQPGASLSHYRIVEKIGEGGMGEVYRGVDTRLNREVAIKLLPPGIAGEDRLRRFKQEAEATSALNHPNILTVYDIGEHEGSPFIVAELLAGEELRELLNKGAIPLRKTIEYAQQIVSGLSAAHEKGIVHRDLKPENIFITDDERGKILDFGLAKLREVPENIHGSEDATRRAITDPGTVMGTASYMSPEQVRGASVDHRSDIFSFGSILHEMITGRRAFQHETMAETMAAILKEEPAELTASNPNISPSLERIVSRCLEKKPDRRFQSASDLGFALESLSGSTSSSRTSLSEIGVEPERVNRFGRPLLYTLGAVLLAVGVVAGILGYAYFGKSSPPSYHQLTFRRGYISHARFSPDGQTIVYSASWGGNPSEIFSTRSGLNESQSLGLKDADILSVSSTGELAVLTKRKYLFQITYTGTLARVPVIGGTPREVLEDVQEADWSPDGKELAVVRLINGKSRLEYPIGKVLYETDGYIGSPRVSPKGDRIAFLDHEISGDNRGRVAMVDLAGTKSVLTEDYAAEEGLTWSAAGDEIWFTSSKNGESNSLNGVTLSGKVREVLSIPGDLWVHDVTRDGRTLITRYRQTADVIGLAPGDTRERDLSWLDYGGIPALSADGKTFVYTHWGQGSGNDYSVFLGKTDGSPAVKIGAGAANSISPDGKWVISKLLSSNEVFALPTGAGEPKRLNMNGIKWSRDIEWLPDSKQVIFAGNEGGKPERMYVLGIDSGGVPRAVTTEGVSGGGISPDGRSIICGKKPSVAVCSIDGSVPARPIPGLGDSDKFVSWAADGRSIFVSVYEDLTLKVSRLDLATGRKEPFKEIIPSDKAGIFYDPIIRITPDGKGYIYSVRRYLMDLFLADGLK